MTDVIQQEVEEPRALAHREIPRPMGVPSVGSGSVVELLHEAVRQGTPVDQLKELVTLHERMEAREARRQYFEALAAFQEDAPLVRQNHTASITTKSGSKYSYTFAPLDEIIRAISPFLRKHGLSYAWNSVVEKGSITVTCTISHTFGHSETSSMTLPVENASAMSDQQKVGAAYTFGQRRTLTSALGLVTTDSEAPEAEVDTTPVDEAQLTTIEDMIAATEANEAKFLRFMGVEKLAQIPAARFEEAITALKATAARREARKS